MLLVSLTTPTASKTELDTPIYMGAVQSTHPTMSTSTSQQPSNYYTEIRDYALNYGTEMHFILLSAVLAASSTRRDVIFVPAVDIVPSDISTSFGVNELIIYLIDNPINTKLRDSFVHAIHTIITKKHFDIKHNKLSTVFEAPDTASSHDGHKRRDIKFPKILDPERPKTYITFNIEEFSITYDRDTELKFTGGANTTSTQRSSFLFHGSGIENWYSIISNGIKNCSGTGLQLNGAAYGNGVYLSDTLAVSLSYGQSREFLDSPYIIGIFEVFGNINDFRKAPSIFVVDDPKRVLLRHILRCDNMPNCRYHDYDPMSRELMVRVNRLRVNANKDKHDAAAIRDRRLTAELKKMPVGSGVVVVVEEPESVYDTITWALTAQRGNELHYALLVFKENYPISPPIIVDDNGIRISQFGLLTPLHEIINSMEFIPGYIPRATISEIHEELAANKIKCDSILTG